jgi:molybdopterin converting factor small subunit
MACGLNLYLPYKDCQQSFQEYRREVSRRLWDNRDTMSGTSDQTRDETNDRRRLETGGDTRHETRGDTGAPAASAVIVSLPAALTSPEAPLELSVEAGTVGDALRAVAAQAPRFAQRIFYKGRPLVTVVLNGRHLPPSGALATETSAGDRIQLMPPVAGG